MNAVADPSVIIGLGCGLATTTVPLVLADLAPNGIKKALGILNQLFIVLGILVAQSLSFPLGKEMLWRGVPGIAAGIGILQLVGSVFVRLKGNGGHDPDVESEPLLGNGTFYGLSFPSSHNTADNRRLGGPNHHPRAPALPRPSRNSRPYVPTSPLTLS